MEQTRGSFAELVAPGDGSLAGDLDHGALLIATALDPTVDMERCLDQLDQLAEQQQGTTAAELAVGLFGGAAHDPSVHFSGNSRRYYDPENSMLNCVLDRRIGIPITLAVLTIEIGRRCDISLHGVGMPGHFLVGCAEGFIDPFHQGVLLHANDCQKLFERLAGRGARLPEGALAATPPALILKRMLLNLSAIATNGQKRRMLRAVCSLLAAFPDTSHREHVQHAYAAAEIAQYAEAAVAGERALVTIPEQLQDRLQAQIDQWRARLN